MWKLSANWRKKIINIQYQLKKLGGGALLEMSHELDYINWIFEKNIRQKHFILILTSWM